MPLRRDDLEQLDRDDRARLLGRLTIAMIVMAVLGAVASLLEPRNHADVTLFFYGVVIAWLAVVALVARHGRLALAAWLLTSMFWVLIAAVTVLFGGMQGQNAACFGVCVLLLGSLVGGRAAIGLALVSTAWCGLIAVLERGGHLPTPLAPYSPVNAWAATTITLVLTAVLLASALAAHGRLRDRADRSARERDEALRRSFEGQKMEVVGRVTAGIAHDFNNLLTVIGSVGEALRAEVSTLGPDGVELLDSLDEATSRATLITRQLTSFGRSTSASAGATAVDVGVVLEGLARMLPPLLGPRITVDRDLAPGAVVAAPRASLEQIVLNLAVNARQAMPEGGRLRLATTVDATTVTVIAEDDGVGMPPEVQARIFEPFFSTRPTGSGLGLATVHRLVTELGGRIVVDSAPGRGTRFAIALPRSAAAVVTPAPRATPPPMLAGGRRVLVVEDDPLTRRSIVRWLTSAGFEPIPVADGVEALGVVRAITDLSCVVSDLAMPRLDGDDLRARLPGGTPLVMISGDRQPTVPVGERVRFVPKPLTREALLAAIAEVTAPSRPAA